MALIGLRTTYKVARTNRTATRAFLNIRIIIPINYFLFWGRWDRIVVWKGHWETLTVVLKKLFIPPLDVYQ